MNDAISNTQCTSNEIIFIGKKNQVLWNVTMIVMLLIHVPSRSATQSVVLTPQVHYTVFQNDSLAVFCCIGNGFGSGAVVSWTLNGTGYSTHHAQGGITVSTDPPTEATVSSCLSIPCNSINYSNTEVVCRIADVTLQNSLTSQSAILTIQGPLDAPNNFSVNISNTSNTTFLLSWGAPFSLDVTNSPDIFYYILCTNITIYGCRTIPSYPDCTFPGTCTSSVDFTDPSLNGTNGGLNKTIMDYGDPIQFTFYAVNGAGNGSMANSTYVKSDTGFATSPVETTFISISISPTPSIASNFQSEVSRTVWIAIGSLCCGCILIAGVLVISCAIKHSSTKRKRPGMDCCAEPPVNVELYSYATHHDSYRKSTTDTTDQEKKLDGYIEVSCSQIISIPAPPDEVQYSDVIPPHNQPKSEKSCYTDVACHLIVSIPVPHQKVQYSEVTYRASCDRVNCDSGEDETESMPLLAWNNSMTLQPKFAPRRTRSAWTYSREKNKKRN